MRSRTSRSAMHAPGSSGGSVVGAGLVGGGVVGGGVVGGGVVGGGVVGGGVVGGGVVGGGVVGGPVGAVAGGARSTVGSDVNGSDSATTSVGSLTVAAATSAVPGEFGAGFAESVADEQAAIIASSTSQADRPVTVDPTDPPSHVVGVERRSSRSNGAHDVMEHESPTGVRIVGDLCRCDAETPARHPARRRRCLRSTGQRSRIPLGGNCHSRC